MKHGFCKYLDHITLVQMKYYVVHVNREFKQQRQQRSATKTSLQNKDLGNGNYISDYYFFLASFFVHSHAANGLVEAR